MTQNHICMNWRMLTNPYTLAWHSPLSHKNLTGLNQIHRVLTLHLTHGGWMKRRICTISLYIIAPILTVLYIRIYLKSSSFIPNSYRRTTHLTWSKLLTWHLFPKRRYTCSFSSRVSSMELGWSVPDSDFMFYDKTGFCKQFLKLNNEQFLYLQLMRILKYKIWKYVSAMQWCSW
jgi:hypothetical protein